VPISVTARIGSAALLWVSHHLVFVKIRDGVSCLASLSCTTVGDYNPGNGDGVPYAEQEH